MSEEPEQFSAFISYASADKVKADEVCASLEAHGFQCWIAPRNIRAGHDYADAIIHGIHASKCLILILSKAANESPFVHREVERAVSANKMVFPMRIEEVLPSATLELFVSSAHWIDAWKGKLDDHIAHLARDLSDDQSSYVKTPAPPAPAQKKSPMLVLAIALVVILAAAGLIGARLMSHSPPPPAPMVASVAQSVAPAPAPSAPAPAAVTPAPVIPVVQTPTPAPVAPIAPRPIPIVTPMPPPPIPKPLGSIQLTPSATPNGQQPLTVYEIYRSNSGKFEYTFLCPPNTVTIRASYDGQGYFETPARSSPRPYPMTLQDWPAGEDLRLVFRDANGNETGPFEFAHQDRQAIVVSTLKSEFIAREQFAVDGFFVPFTLPFTDDPKQQLADAQAATDPATRQQLLTTYRTTLQNQRYVTNQLRAVGCAFVNSAPTVASIPDGRIPLVDWAAVREVHIGDKTGQTQTVVPVNIDWNGYLKDGNQYFNENPDLIRDRHTIWSALLPPDATDVYATFIFRDGSSSDEMRYRVDTTRLRPLPQPQ